MPQASFPHNKAMTFHLVAWLLVQNNAGQILLGRRGGASYGAGLWGLPGGHVEGGETLLAAALREAREEVGVSVDPAEAKALGVCRYDLDGVQGTSFFFLARRWSGEAVALDKTSEVGWFKPDALPSDVLPWLPAVLEAHLERGEWLSELLD